MNLNEEKIFLQETQRILSSGRLSEPPNLLPIKEENEVDIGELNKEERAMFLVIMEQEKREKKEGGGLDMQFYPDDAPGSMGAFFWKNVKKRLGDATIGFGRMSVRKRWKIVAFAF